MSEFNSTGARRSVAVAAPSGSAAWQEQEQQQRQQQERPKQQTLGDKPKDELQRLKDEFIQRQAENGEQPGLMMMQDRLSQQSKQEMWGVVSNDVYDEGAAQVSFASPGLSNAVPGTGSNVSGGGDSGGGSGTPPAVS